MSIERLFADTLLGKEGDGSSTDENTLKNVMSKSGLTSKKTIKMSIMDAFEKYEADTFGVNLSENSLDETLKIILERSGVDEKGKEDYISKIRDSIVEVCNEEISMLGYLTWHRKRPEKVKRAENEYDISEGDVDDDEIQIENVIIENHKFDIYDYLEWYGEKSEFLETIEKIVECNG